MNGFTLGTSTVPDGKQGDWEVGTFSITDDDVLMMNLRAIRDGNPYMVCPAGTYRRLTHKSRGTVMSNTPMERHFTREAYDAATGSVLVTGLGLGMLLEALISKPDVNYIRVIEKDEDVIRLVGPHFANEPKADIIHGDAFQYLPDESEYFDYAWHDIWDNIDPDNLPEMAKLTRRYVKWAKAQGVWSRPFARREKRRYG